MKDNCSIIFISNYFDHHTKPLSDALYRATGGNYTFLACGQMTEERIKLGWANIDIPGYVASVDIEDRNQLKKWSNTIIRADAVIIGSAPDLLVRKRLCLGKLTFRYNERMYKSRYPSRKELLVRRVRHFFSNRIYNNLYLLSASAYAPYDYSLTGCFLNKAYRFGYFTELKCYDLDALYSKKAQEKSNNYLASILWAARFIDWKHPERVLAVATFLKRKKLNVKISMIGTGPLLEYTIEMIKEQELSDFITVLGPMTPQKVREYMEKSDIFLMTSDRNEGWGAVINESMNSACAVVASNEAGAVPYVIKDGVNGFVYKDNDLNDLFDKVEHLVLNENLRKQLGYNAYQTIQNTWNASVAADNFIKLVESKICGNEHCIIEGGPCSVAPIMKEDCI